MKTLKILCSALLILSLLLSFAACEGNAGNGNDTETVTDDSTPVDTALSMLAEADYPTDESFGTWYDLAREREQVSTALLYSADGIGVWNCWLYVGAFTSGDRVTLDTESEEGIIALHHTAADADKSGSNALFYFTVACDGEPEFEFYQNGTFEGAVYTKAKDGLN